MIERETDRRRPSLRLLVVLILVVLTVVFGRSEPVSARTDREHLVFFKDTQHELNVYKIHGRKEGPTMMIIGGIQGDEPGGFLSADLYADLALSKGNLIVVPRANFYSILLFKRGPNGDMNRKFGVENKDDVESLVVREIERLIAEADVLLNLHDGWGFYRPQYVDKMHNPNRYGQSIIADTAEYLSPRTGRKLNLESMAKTVIEKINAQIDDARYSFHFMNTRTNEGKSPYAEQRTSATYYALTRYGIPAFGVETSKNLPSIEMKVHQHNLAVNAFMELFGIEPEQPRIYLEKPKLEYLVISINNQVPVAVPDGKVMVVNPGDRIEVVHVGANYDRGLSVDILGVGTINDFRRSFQITKPTFIVAQKDHIKFGRIAVVLREAGTPGVVQVVDAGDMPGVVQPEDTSATPATGQTMAMSAAHTEPTPEPAVTEAVAAEAVVPEPAVADKPFSVKAFLIEVEGERREVPEGGILEVVESDKIKVVDFIAEGVGPKGLVVNFKGFVSNQSNNIGEDRGHVIDTGRNLLARYSLSRTEKIYEVVVEKAKSTFGRMTVKINPPQLDYLILRRNGGEPVRMNNGHSVNVKPGDLIQVVELKTNVPENRGIGFKLEGGVTREEKADVLFTFRIHHPRNATLFVTREGQTIGKILLQSG